MLKPCSLWIVFSLLDCGGKCWMGYTNTSDGSIFCVSSLCCIVAITEVIHFAQQSWNMPTKRFCRAHRDSCRGTFFLPVHCRREMFCSGSSVFPFYFISESLGVQAKTATYSRTWGANKWTLHMQIGWCLYVYSIIQWYHIFFSIISVL